MTNPSPIKLIRFLSFLTSFTLSSAIFGLWANGVGLSLREKRRRQASRLSFAAKKALDLLQIQISSVPTLPTDPGLIVSNHLSTLDILVLAAIHPALFVTSTEVKNQWGLGWICRAAGCLFVNRRNKQRILAEIREIQEALLLGSSVVVFPEGTSTDGRSLLPFKASLFQSAIDAEVPVHIYSIHYSHAEIAYYGEISFWRHLRELCKARTIQARVRYLGSEKAHQEKVDRFQLANRSHKMIFNALLSY